MAVRHPCKTCPWRTDRDASTIPGFQFDLVDRLERCSDGALDSPQFGCHQSNPGEEFVCAGWLSVEGWDSLGVRLGLADGTYTKEQLDARHLDPTWPEMEPSLRVVLDKLRATAPDRPED